MKRMMILAIGILSVSNVTAQDWIKVPANYSKVLMIDNHWMDAHDKISFKGVAEGTRFAFLGRVDRIASSNDGSSATISSYIAWLVRLSSLSDEHRSVGHSVNLVFIFRDMPVIKKDEVVVLYGEFTGKVVGDTAPWPDLADVPLLHGEFYVCDSGFKNF